MHVLLASIYFSTKPFLVQQNQSTFRLIRSEYPAVWAWIRKFEDLSGLETAHCDNAEFLREILSFAGEVYLPFLAANSAALDSGDKEVSVSLWREDPILHTQPTFKYQQKCFKRIRQSYAELLPDQKERAKKLLDGTDCTKFLE